MAQFLLSAFADEANTELGGQIAALKRNGIPNLEPRSISGGILKKTDAELKEIRARLDAEGIGISAIGSPIGKADITNDFDAYLAGDFKRSLEICHALGTNRLRMFSFFVEQDQLAKYRDEVIRRLNAMVAMASAEGILLCHENESKIYGQNPGEVADLFASVPGLRGVFDAANYVMNDQDPIAGYEATAPYLEYLHIKDANQAEKMIMPVGTGDGQYEEILRRVDAMSDKTFYLTLEPHLHIFAAYQKIDSHKLKTGVEFDDSDTAFDCAATHLKNLLTKIGFHEENHVWKK